MHAAKYSIDLYRIIVDDFEIACSDCKKLQLMSKLTFEESNKNTNRIDTSSRSIQADRSTCGPHHEAGSSRRCDTGSPGTAPDLPREERGTQGRHENHVLVPEADVSDGR